MKLLPDWLKEILVCPECRQNLEIYDNERKIICSGCLADYNIIGFIPVFNQKTSSSLENFDYTEHYKKDAELFDYYEERKGATEDDERRVHEYVLSAIPPDSVLVLDVGCGRAWLARDMVKRKIRICSLDISLTNPEKAIMKYPSEYHFAIVADAYSLPFRNDSFDVIVASEVIEHTPEPEIFVKNLFRCLKPGGKLIITTPYKEVIQHSLCIHCNKKTPHNAHLHSFDENILAGLYTGKDLKKVGWQKFGNKALLHLRSYVILKYLPFGLWKFIDRFMNFIINKPAHIIVEYLKK